MHKLKSEDSLFIFSFDGKLFLNEKACLNYEYEYIEDFRWAKSICSSEVFNIQVEKMYKIRTGDIEVGGDYYYAFKDDSGRTRHINLRYLENYFQVFSKEEEFAIVAGYTKEKEISNAQTQI